MALAFVGTTPRTRVTGQASTTLAITVANAGSLIVVNSFISNGGGSTVSVSDADGSYTAVVANGTAPDASSQGHQHYRANHPAGAYTVTVDPAGSSADIEFFVSEITGAATSTPLDSNSGQTTAAMISGSGTWTITSGSPLAQAANIVFVLGTHTVDDRTLTSGNIQGSAATLVGENESNSGGQCGHVEYRIINSTSAVTSTIGFGAGISAGTYGMLQGIYKEAGAAPLAVNFDTSAEVQRTATTDPQTWTHTPGTNPNGIVVAVVHGTTSTDHVSTMTYGGVSMTRAVTAVDTSTETGRADLWFLGSSIPTGPQTVSVDLASATTDDIHFVSISLYTDDASNMEVIDTDLINENATNPSVTLNYSGRTAIAIAALYGGGASPAAFVPNANCSAVQDFAIAAFYSTVIRQTTPGTADFAIGGTAVADDVAYVAIAVAKVIAGGAATNPKGWVQTLGGYW